MSICSSMNWWYLYNGTCLKRSELFIKLLGEKCPKARLSLSPFPVIHNFTWHFGRVRRDKSHPVISLLAEAWRTKWWPPMSKRGRRGEAGGAREGEARLRLQGDSQGPCGLPRTSVTRRRGQKLGRLVKSQRKCTSCATYHLPFSLRFLPFALSVTELAPVWRQCHHLISPGIRALSSPSVSRAVLSLLCPCPAFRHHLSRMHSVLHNGDALSAPTQKVWFSRKASI